MVVQTPDKALSECVRIAGSQSKLARDLGISQPSVFNWFKTALKRMPARHVLKAERLYGVSRHALRPDIYPRDEAVLDVSDAA